MIWMYLTILLTLLYLILIRYYHFHWSKIPEIKGDKASKCQTKVSIIVIGRNEADNIDGCLKSIAGNAYPRDRYEIIFVDDHSEDDSLEKLKKLSISNLRILELKDFLSGRKVNAYKKEAITYALTFADGDLILHTDADTLVGEYWIQAHVTVFENKKPLFIAAPVFFIAEQNLVQQFQQLDFITTMGITAVGINTGLHFMANGANMSYKCSLPGRINRTKDWKFASGDDMFLIHEAAGINAAKVVFLKNREACVYTYAEKNWRAFLRQRVRWATKTRGYKDYKLKTVLGLVFLFNLSLLINLTVGLFHSFFALLFIAQFSIKSIVDYHFIRKVQAYFDLQISIKSLLISFLLYPVYYLIIGFSGILLKKYNWKNRRVY